MKNISFGSNYIVNVKSNFPSHVYKALDDYQLTPDVKVYSDFTSIKEAQETGVLEKLTVCAPDNYDSEIEALLFANGINFHKQTLKEALDIDNIKNRIQLSETDKWLGYQLVTVNTDILNDLLKKDGISYIEPNGKNGIGDRYQGVGEYLKTGKDINPTRVYFSEEAGKLKARVEDGRHRFAYFRDMGMQKIPIAMCKESLEVAKKYGLIN